MEKGNDDYSGYGEIWWEMSMGTLLHQVALGDLAGIPVLVDRLVDRGLLHEEIVNIIVKTFASKAGAPSKSLT